jgi:hypothetical protein
MREGEWLTSAEPDAMLGFLRRKAGDRKLRLFACACVRRTPAGHAETVWDLLGDARSRRAVELAERYADGEVGDAALAQAHAASRSAVREAALWAPSEAVVSARMSASEAADAAYQLPWDAAAAAAHWAATAAHQGGIPGERGAAEAHIARLLREVFGNPFRPLRVEAGWATWQAGVVARLARAAYDVRRLPPGTLDGSRLAVLADALEEAGCTDPAILGHLRLGEDHVRGCFVLDGLLGRE